jgi:hypothetical protein
VEKEVSNHWMTLREQEGIGNWNIEAIDPTLWRTSFGRVYGASQR